jgi:hypothetical protein
MEKVVYFLGAGFSEPLGLPISSNFIEKSKDLYFSDSDKYRHFSQVLTTINGLSNIKNYINSNLFNIEEVLSILEMKLRIDEQKPREAFSNYICDVIEAYTPKIKHHEFQSHLWKSELFGKNIDKKYGWFALALQNAIVQEKELEPTHRLGIGYSVDINKEVEYSIVTLNYDTVMERFNNYLDNVIIGKDFVGFTKNIGKGTPIIKLHGSAGDKKIIPPTWNKFVNTEVLELWRDAYKLLSEANYIRIIGYSLPETDAYIRYLFKAAINDSKHLKRIDAVVLDNTFESHVINRYKEFIVYPTFRIKNANTIDYLNSFYNYLLDKYLPYPRKDMPNVAPLLEKTHESFMNS